MKTDQETLIKCKNKITNSRVNQITTFEHWVHDNRDKEKTAD